MRILHMTLKKHWFDMIKANIKKEEYRQLKGYWAKRLKKDYDIVRFRNGYSTTSPVIDVEYKGVRVGMGKPEWGAVEESFIISLGTVMPQTVNP